MLGPLGAAGLAAHGGRIASVAHTEELGELEAGERIGAGDVERAGGGRMGGIGSRAASSSSAAARSATAIGQRTSSVKKAMSDTPSAASRAKRSAAPGAGRRR